MTLEEPAVAVVAADTPPRGIEAVYQQMARKVRAEFKDALAGVIADAGYRLPMDDFRGIYNSLRYTGLITPSCFILPQGSRRDNRTGQNWSYVVHEVIVAALVEYKEEAALTNLVWRYLQALDYLFHYSSLDGDGTLQTLSLRRDYGGIWTRGRSELRTFRADGYLVVEVHQFESF